MQVIKNTEFYMHLDLNVQHFLNLSPHTYRLQVYANKFFYNFELFFCLNYCHKVVLN